MYDIYHISFRDESSHICLEIGFHFFFDVKLASLFLCTYMIVPLIELLVPCTREALLVADDIYEGKPFCAGNA